MRTPSTGGKHQSITQPCLLRAPEVTQCLGLQGELNTNLLRSGSLKDSGSQAVLFFRKLACSLKANRILEEFGSQRHLGLLLFIVHCCLFYKKKKSCFLKFSVLHGIDDGRLRFLSVSPEQGLLA